MLPGAVIAAQGAEIVFTERLDAGFGIDLGGREISLLQFDHAVSASAGALEALRRDKPQISPLRSPRFPNTTETQSPVPQTPSF
jgi:hypothetical protein